MRLEICWMYLMYPPVQNGATVFSHLGLPASTSQAKVEDLIQAWFETKPMLFEDIVC